MIIKLLKKIEEVLESIDVGGEQSRQFAGEIKLLKEIIGLPNVPEDEMGELQMRELIAAKLWLLAVEAQGLKADMPAVPVEKWLDGTAAGEGADVYCQQYDLAKLLRYISDIGVSCKI